MTRLSVMRSVALLLVTVYTNNAILLTLQAEDSCLLVSSRGIMKSCDVHPHIPQSDTQEVNPLDYAPVEQQQGEGTAFLQEGEVRSQHKTTVNASHYLKRMHGASNTPVVYVVTTALKDFERKVLPSVTRPFVLVTGDSDACPTRVLGESGFAQLASHPHVIRWFAQNSIVDHPKVERMPIGLDYHSIAAGKFDWGPLASPRQQETELLQVRWSAPEFADRHKQVFESHMVPRNYRRQHIEDMIEGNPMSVLAKTYGATTRHQFWKSLSAYQFGASPVGNGVDCHRTWETLALGGVPIVDQTGLNSLFRDNGLPYIEADDSGWSNLDGLIQKGQSLHVPGKRDILPALTLKYWVQKFRAAADQAGQA